MELNIENVESALTQFYRTNSSMQAEAHRWLMSLQNSPTAWSFVWDLLQPERSCEAQFFGSNTLHLKLVHNWNEVPEAEYDNLKNKLLETIVAYSNGPKIVLNRLCIALAVYILRVTPSHWENSIEDVHNIFRAENLVNVPHEKSMWILLEILAVIPEELLSLSLSKSQKQFTRAKLRKALPKVMITLESVLTSNSGEVRSLAAKGICSWFALDACPSLPGSLNLSAKIVDVVIQTQAADPFESCENEIEALGQIMTNQHTLMYKTAVIPGLEIILQLAPLLQGSENQEFITNVYNLFINFGETHGTFLLSCLASNEPRCVQHVQGLLKCLLGCLSAEGTYPRDETHSHLVISFWSTLFDEYTVLIEEEKKIISRLLEPLYIELCMVLLYKSQFPPDSVVLTASESELLRIYRQDIADTIVNCYRFVRHALINILNTRMTEAKTWQEVEALLHIIHSLAETTWSCCNEDGDSEVFEIGVLQPTKEEEDERRAVMSLLIKIPSNMYNSPVINSLNLAIGAYAESWSSHQELLGALIPTIIASLRNPQTSTSATMTLKDITRECTTSIQPFAHTLLNACQEALESRKLKEDEYVRLMYSVGRLLSILPYNEMVSKLDIIITYYATELSNALQKENNDESKSVIWMTIRMLGNLCSSLYLAEQINADPPSVMVLTRLLPHFAAITEKWSSNLSIIEETCRCMSNCVINLTPNESHPFIPEVAKVGLAGYIAQPNSVFLEMTRQLFILYGLTKTEFVSELVRSASEATYNLAKNSSTNCDVFNTYFQTMTAICKRNIRFLSATLNLKELFSLATVALTAAESLTVKSSGQLLSNLIGQSRNHKPAAEVIVEMGEQLVFTIIQCIGSLTTPTSYLYVMGDVLLALNKGYCQLLAKWLNNVLSRKDFPTNNATTEAKTHFVKTVLRDRSSGNRIVEAVKEFSLICRVNVHVNQ